MADLTLKNYLDILRLGLKITLVNNITLSRDRINHVFLIEENNEIKEISQEEITNCLLEDTFWEDTDGEKWSLNELKTDTLNNILNNLKSQDEKDILKQFLRERNISDLI